MRSYIKKEWVKEFQKAPVESFKVRLGGERLSFKEVKIVTGFVKDTSERRYCFAERFFEVNNLGEENGKEIDVLLGSVILEDWGADIDESVSPPQVDFCKLRKGELVEL
ncbi:MAG: hypothetical protein QMD71_09500 [bacterium]|nr:hypothetical protein [bacterium]